MPRKELKMIKRAIEEKIRADFGKGKVVLVLGARQVGKTTLLRQLSEDATRPLLLNCDNPDDRELLSHASTTSLDSLVGRADFVLIDEAQRAENVGLTLKMLADTVGDRAQVVATGSSALELANGIFESAAGRVFEYRLYPFSFGELATGESGARDERRLLESRLVFGSYPEVVTAPDDARRILEAIVDGALYKDILAFGGIRKSDALVRLVQCLALQLGSEVSYGELASATGLNKATVETYVDLLEKSFFVFRLPSMARNARNEIRKGKKIYFYDLGVRNAVMGNFSRTSSRTDSGGMWENYLILERLKNTLNLSFPPQCFFWRATGPQGKEIDYLEKTSNTLRAWEIKFNPASKAKIPLSFKRAYPDAETDILTPANYDKFLLHE